MRELFPGFYNRTDEELSNMWIEGIFVFDTNMLLHVYEYSNDTRERFFETLSKLQERIWIPYQVAFEYQRRRMKVIVRQRDSYKSASKYLDKALQIFKDGLEPYKKDKHAFINTEDLIKKVSQEITNTKTEIQRAGSRHPDYKITDPFRKKLEKLFSSRVGNNYDNETLKMKYKEAQVRLDNEIPPGFEDASKSPFDRYGDILVWLQIIDYAKTKKKPIIFITDDVKKDWWIPQEESFGVRKPRSELVQEMFVETGMLFHMYEGYDFMDEAQKYLNLEAKPDVIEEIKEIGQQDAILHKFANSFGTFSNNMILRRAVHKWLLDTFPIGELQPEPPGGYGSGIDLISVASDGMVTGFQIHVYAEDISLTKYRHFIVKSPQLFINNLLKKVEDYITTALIDKFVLVIICERREAAKMIMEGYQKQPIFSPNIGIIVGYLDGKGDFQEVFGVY